MFAEADLFGGDMLLYLSCFGRLAFVFELFWETCCCISVVLGDLLLYLSCFGRLAVVFELFWETCCCI